MANRYPDDRDQYGPAWADERNYSSERPYGDRPYGWPGREDDDARRGVSRSAWGRHERVDPQERRQGVPGDWAERDYGWRPAGSMPSYSRVGHGHYAEPGYLGDEYGPRTYGGAYTRERAGAREWSSVEGWRVPGPHTGRGPRGYQRPDERIREEVNERLTAHGLIDASDVECRVVNGEVTLTGFVDSRAAKRAAADLAEDIYGVRDVHNELRIRSHATDEGVGRTSVLGLTDEERRPGVPADRAQMQSTHSPAATPAGPGRPRTRT